MATMNALEVTSITTRVTFSHCSKLACKDDIHEAISCCSFKCSHFFGSAKPPFSHFQSSYPFPFLSCLLPLRAQSLACRRPCCSLEGLTEMREPIGIIVSPPLQKRLERIGGSHNVAVKGIEYSNDLVSIVAGAYMTLWTHSKMFEACEDVMKNCPASKVILVEYRQGTKLVHSCLKPWVQCCGRCNKCQAFIYLDKLAHSNRAVITSSDCIKKTLDRAFCAHGDLVCRAIGASPPHTSYTAHQEQLEKQHHG
jgi:hypothetical protein